LLKIEVLELPTVQTRKLTAYRERFCFLLYSVIEIFQVSIYIRKAKNAFLSS